MAKLLVPVSIALLITTFSIFPAFAQTEDEPLPPQAFPPDEFYVGKVVEILKEEAEDHQGVKLIYQEVSIEIIKGDLKGTKLEIRHGGGTDLPAYQRVKKGEKVVIAKTEFLGEVEYYIADKYRLNALLTILLIFFAIVISFSRWKGLASIVGLVITILILVQFIVPRIIEGHSPLWTGFIGAVIIALLSLFAAHGFNKRTAVALVSTLLTLVVASLLALLFVSFAKLFGIGTEEAFYLQLSPLQTINLQGLLLAGIVIGALGVLDDVTTAQTAAVEELKKANASFSFSELYHRGLSVGKEHIASLVNTLVLAYAGTSLPLFLLFSTNKTQPLWTLLNSDFMAEEIVRTLVGSTALVLAVPISTLLAAYFFAKQNKS